MADRTTIATRRGRRYPLPPAIKRAKVSPVVVSAGTAVASDTDAGAGVAMGAGVRQRGPPYTCPPESNGQPRHASGSKACRGKKQANQASKHQTVEHKQANERQREYRQQQEGEIEKCPGPKGSSEGCVRQSTTVNTTQWTVWAIDL